MIQKLKNKLVILASLLIMATPAMVPVAAYAANDATFGGLCGGSNLQTSASQAGCTAQTGGSKLQGLLKSIVNWISIVVGVVAVIMIIIGGFKYITSGGESSNVSGAKNTIIYAIIGLIIVALAQLIVHFVLGQTQNVVQ